MSTDRELAEAADAAARATTITYAEWSKRLAQGKYPDPSKTQWWKLFDALGKIDKAPVPPPQPGVPPFARTNYANVPDGGLDPLWQQHGRHMGPGCYIGAEADPLGGDFRVQRQTVVDGGIFSGGERAEVLNTDKCVTPRDGGRFQVAYELLLPIGFKSSASFWNGLCQMHYAGAIAQSPWSVSVINSGDIFYRTLGGPLNSDGTMGTIKNDGVVARLTPGVWHTLCMDVRLDLTDGLFDLWVDGQRVLNLRASTLSPDPSGGNSCYFKQGFYRSANDPGTATYYFQDTLWWREQSPAAMLSWYGYTP